MTLEKKILNLKDDIRYVKEGAEFSKPVIMNEAYPSNPYLGEFGSVYAFIEATEYLIGELEKLVEELEE